MVVIRDVVLDMRSFRMLDFGNVQLHKSDSTYDECTGDTRF